MDESESIIEIDVDSSDTTSTTSTSQQIINPWPSSDGKLYYKCQLCLLKQTTIKAHISSYNNIKQYMRRIHSSKYMLFEERVKAGSKRGKKRTSNSSPIPETVGSSVNKMQRQQNIGESQSYIYKGPYRSAMANDRSLWNQQSRSTVAAAVLSFSLQAKFFTTL